MLRRVLAVTLLLFLVPLAPAQSKEEQRLNEKQAKLLHGYAADALKAGFPRVAKRVWLMLLSEYEPDHAEARKALGYQRLGDSWAVDPAFAYPKDDNPDPRKADALQKDWQSVAGRLAREHQKLAEQYDKAGRADMARRHFEKVIFFTPGDAAAQAALEHKPIAGLTGTDIEQVLYERSKKIEAIVAEEARKDYPVTALPDDNKHPFLEKARVKYTSVSSEHFVVRGDFEPELLMEAARHGERAIRVMKVVTEGYTGFNEDPNRWIREWAFFQDGDTYKQVLTANAELMKPEELKFRLDHTRGSNLIGPDRVALDLSAPLNDQGVYDGAVRNVARSHGGMRSPGLNEGIGHTIVGMMFNNNRAFIVDRQEQLRSTTGEEDLDRYSPNMDTWKDLALEAAWKLSEGLPAAQLPLIDAAKFTDDARIKAWSFCDYLIRRDPTLMLGLDKLGGSRDAIEVDKKFTEAHEGLSVTQLEKEWKDFWTEATPVLRAIRDNIEPLSTVSRDVKKWLSAFNDARKLQRQAEVTWSSDYSGRCREHVEYLIANPDARGAAAEHTQELAREGGSHLGSLFAEMAIVETSAGRPRDVFKRWLDIPGYRDALLNYRLRMIGLYSQDDVLVLDVIRGVGQPPDGKGGLETFPGGTNESMPTSVKVADLGPELRELLARHGHGDREVIGYPISLHQFGNGGLTGNRESYRCSVTIMGNAVEGLLHIADGGSNRRTSAPGMVVFYPLEPLRKGVEVEAVWTFENDKGTTRIPTKFRT